MFRILENHHEAVYENQKGNINDCNVCMLRFKIITLIYIVLNLIEFIQLCYGTYNNKFLNSPSNKNNFILKKKGNCVFQS